LGASKNGGEDDRRTQKAPGHLLRCFVGGGGGKQSRREVRGGKKKKHSKSKHKRFQQTTNMKKRIATAEGEGGEKKAVLRCQDRNEVRDKFEGGGLENGGTRPRNRKKKSRIALQNPDRPR